MSTPAKQPEETSTPQVLFKSTPQAPKKSFIAETPEVHQNACEEKQAQEIIDVCFLNQAMQSQN